MRVAWLMTGASLMRSMTGDKRICRTYGGAERLRPMTFGPSAGGHIDRCSERRPLPTSAV
jgi:hypothetical protein